MMTTLYIYTHTHTPKIIHVQTKNIKTNYRFKMAAKLPILVSRQNVKNHFPRGIFFNEIWLIKGDHENINIAKIKIGNFLYRWDFRGKTFSPHPPC